MFLKMYGLAYNISKPPSSSPNVEQIGAKMVGIILWNRSDMEPGLWVMGHGSWVNVFGRVAGQYI